GHGEAADGLDVLGVAAAGDRVALDLHGVAAAVGVGHVLDVVAVVGLRRPLRVARLEPAQARLHRARQVLDLHAGVVVVELALDLPAVGVEHAGDAVADRRGAAVAHVQRAGRVGRDVFHAGGAALAGGVAAVLGAVAQHAGDLALPRARGQVEVDEARPGDLHPGDVVAGGEGLDQRLGQRARVGARGLGQQHRRVGGEVAMLAGLGALDHEVGRGGVGGQLAGDAQGFDTLADQGLQEDLHGGPVLRFGRLFYPVRGPGP